MPEDTKLGYHQEQRRTHDESSDDTKDLFYHDIQALR